VQALHDAGLVHRDLKPENVLVDRDGRVVIVDPGIALDAEDSVPRSGTPTGTLGYMAPEQLTGAAHGPWTDWYAVGVLLFELLAGLPPHRGAMLEVLTQRELAVMPSFAELPGGESDAWVEVIAGLLARAPAERQAGAARLGDRFATAGSALAPPPLIGRGGELVRLDAAWRSKDERRVVAVVGPSGTGKSRLVEAWAATLRQRPDVRVISSRCDPRGSVPFRGLDRLLELLSPRFDIVAEPSWFAALPEPTPIALAAQERVFGELRERLVEAAASRPLVCWMDDAQWAGGDTLALLAELARPPLPTGLLFVLSTRAATELPDAIRRALADEIDIGPLPEAEVLRVVAGNADPAQAAALARITRGDPLLVAEMVRALREGGAVPGAEDALTRRVDRLPDDQRRMFELIALAGGPLDAPTLREFDVGNPLDSVSSLLRSRLLRLETGPSGPAVMPVHARLGEAALRTLVDGERAARHLELASALQTAGDRRDELLSTHLELGGDTAAAARYALRAAETAAARVAYRAARGLLERAFSLDPAVATREARVLHGEVLAALGLGARASEAFLLAGGATGDDASAVRAAEQSLMSGGAAAGEARIVAVLARHGYARPRSRAGVLLGILTAHLRLALGLLPGSASAVALEALWVAAAGVAPFDALGSHWYGAHYALHARRDGDLRTRARSASLEAILLSRFRGTPFGALAPGSLAVARSLAEQAGDIGSRAYAEVAAGAVHWTVQDVRQGLPACERALALYEAHTSRTAHWEASVARLWLHGCHSLAGSSAALRALADFVTDDAAARGDPWALDAGLFSLVVRQRLVEGDRAAAEAELAALRARARPGVAFVGEVLADEAELDLCLAVGDIAGGWAALDRGLALRRQQRPEVIPALAATYYSRRGTVAAAVAAGRGGLSDRARRQAERIARGDRARLRACPAVNANGVADLLDLHVDALAGAGGPAFEARCEAVAARCDAVEHGHWARAARALARASRGERDTSWLGGLYVDLFLPGLVPAGSGRAQL
jgi:tetratricopeptide (TPR) repeat protein